MDQTRALHPPFGHRRCIRCVACARLVSTFCFQGVYRAPYTQLNHKLRLSAAGAAHQCHSCANTACDCTAAESPRRAAKRLPSDSKCFTLDFRSCNFVLFEFARTLTVLQSFSSAHMCGKGIDGESGEESIGNAVAETRPYEDQAIQGSVLERCFQAIHERSFFPTRLPLRRCCMTLAG